LIKYVLGIEDDAHRKILTGGHLLKGVQVGRLVKEVINN